jgi:hypothetical protein
MWYNYFYNDKNILRYIYIYMIKTKNSTGTAASAPASAASSAPPQLTAEQQMFMRNVVRPKKPQSVQESDVAAIQKLTKNKEKNTLNIIHGSNISEYKEYLEARCNKLCLFKIRHDIQPYYKTNKKVKAYIDKNCSECIRTLREFNRALDIAIQGVKPGTDPSSPTANFNMILILIENGTAIFNALPIRFRNDLIKFEPLDGGDIETNKYSLLKQLEINIKSFIVRSELVRRGTKATRIARHGGRKSAKRKTKRKTRRKRNRTRKRKKICKFRK